MVNIIIICVVVGVVVIALIATFSGLCYFCWM